MIYPKSFSPVLGERPKYGVSKIQCAKKKCSWVGLETDMVQVPYLKFKGAMTNTCPKCGGTGYYFV